MEAYKYTGVVHQVGKTQTFQSGFAKRTLVLREPGESKFPNYAVFEFTRSKDGTRDGTRQLDRLIEGQTVEVSFYLSANESRTKPGSWFPSNRAVKVERAGSGVELPMSQKADDPDGAEPEPTVDDMPF